MNTNTKRELEQICSEMAKGIAPLVYADLATEAFSRVDINKIYYQFKSKHQA